MNFLSNEPALVLILIFLCITFLLSAFEKITDWKNTVQFTKTHFKNSPFKEIVPLLLSIILVIESIASILMLIGIFELYTSENKEMALLGLELSAITLLFLLIGQRLAKDYTGASSLGVYFIITIIGVYFLK